MNTRETRIPATQHRQSGVGLIEILIAVVLLSIGFLAAAKMQVEGMRYSQSAYYQSQAYFLAADMIDRMRANPQGVHESEYDNVSTSSSVSDPGCDSASTFCTPKEIAEQDLYDWSKHLHPLDGVTGFIPALPGSPVASVIPVVGATGIYTARLSWSEVVNNSTTTQTLDVNFVVEQRQ